jgi:hypothetical protein
MRITTNVASSNHAQAMCTQCNIMWYKLSVTCVRSGFLQGLRFPPPIKLTAMLDIFEILLKVALNIITIIFWRCLKFNPIRMYSNLLYTIILQTKSSVRFYIRLCEQFARYIIVSFLLMRQWWLICTRSTHWDGFVEYYPTKTIFWSRHITSTRTSSLYCRITKLSTTSSCVVLSKIVV